ncbi:hypothetical protein GCM10009722_14700 [Williamsia deligens]
MRPPPFSFVVVVIKPVSGSLPFTVTIELSDDEPPHAASTPALMTTAPATAASLLNLT